MERLCKDCKHIDDPDLAHAAQCTVLGGRQSPVTGDDLPKKTTTQALYMRLLACGWNDPKWWEPR